ncbi:precorrin-3B C17-methyltransferase [Hyphomicrobium denitrificans 1NES1]|uniref:Precorrin-3B C17-methyltransferase n=1 Tax=Hyphomicrobium denitrificans 1NES1 TaxID=670307 RepID=N0B695_9HYPH|nr:precorrin-3B C(17)-methyltransferase [Hyphomicrobium denitrificans]AGK59094.1 precorrin-3B C17-methyltransferase [Hyphomicrobium denitrificans 1NES1]
MSGQLTIVGLGPGPAEWITPAADATVSMADVVLGYERYIARLAPRRGQIFEASDNREELARATRALELATSGKRVVLVSGGDPGVFAMAAAVFEAVDKKPALANDIDIRVEPGVTAMLAAASRIGAPLGHDFCAISLSDNLKPWATIEKRLRLAAEADFVIALYNPASKARPDQIREAFRILSTIRAPETIVAFARAVGRSDESIEITTLADAPEAICDMRTVVLIGSPATRAVQGRDGRKWVYTPRFARDE